METTDKHVCRESTFKHQNYCHVTLQLQHWGKEKSGIHLKKKMAQKHQNLETFVTLGTGNPENKKGLSWATFIFPPAVRFKTATCGFLLVQADSKYHFIMFSTFLPSSPHPLYFPVSVKAGTETAVWQCAQYDTVQLSIQYSRLTGRT